MINPTTTENKTWINLVFSDKCFNKGCFKFYYNIDNIDSAWIICNTLPIELQSMLYSMSVSTKINNIAKTNNQYVIVFYCNSDNAENVVTRIAEHLNYENREGYCYFKNMTSCQNKKNLSKKITIKKLIKTGCFDSDSDNDSNEDN